jgi:hypothetical protein
MGSARITRRLEVMPTNKLSTTLARSRLEGSWRFRCLPFLIKSRSCVRKHEQEFSTIFIDLIFLGARPAERFFALDCAASTQSSAKPTWPWEVSAETTFSHTIASASPLEASLKPQRLASRMGSRESAGEFLNPLIPQNPQALLG